MESFSESVKIFVDRAKANQDQVVRAVGLKILARIVQRSPVGNPDLWESNQDAVAYRKAVDDHNDALRRDADNLAGNNRLKRGLRVTDTMDNRTGKGYTGGRFRGNWQVTFDEPAVGEVDSIDAAGNQTIATGTAIISQFKVGMNHAIYFTNNVPYAIRLEFGHSKQAPHGIVRVTAQEFQMFVKQAARELNE